MLCSRNNDNRRGGVCILKLLLLLPAITVTGLSGQGFGVSRTTTQQQQHEPTCQNLIVHLLSQKAEIGGVEVGVTTAANSRRGLFATKNIDEGKPICKIPSNLALALSDPANQNHPVDDDTSTMMVRCGANYLTQYANNDVWKWYTETFPKELPLTPDAFSDPEAIELLEFPLALEMVQQRKNDLQTIAVETGLSLDDLRAATTLVSSRSFPIKVAQDDGDIHLDDRGQVITKAGEPAKVIRVLVPLIDMANHKSTNFNAKLVIQDAHKDDAWFVLQATRNIRKGQEITISYGAADSVHLLVDYGFTPDDGNPVDTYLLRKHAKDFTLNDWSTTLQEDLEVMEMLNDGPAVDREDQTLRMVLQFRIQLKQSYADIV